MTTAKILTAIVAALFGCAAGVSADTVDSPFPGTGATSAAYAQASITPAADGQELVKAQAWAYDSRTGQLAAESLEGVYPPDGKRVVVAWAVAGTGSREGAAAGAYVAADCAGGNCADPGAALSGILLPLLAGIFGTLDAAPQPPAAPPAGPGTPFSLWAGASPPFFAPAATGWPAFGNPFARPPDSFARFGPFAAPDWRISFPGAALAGSGPGF